MRGTVIIPLTCVHFRSARFCTICAELKQAAVDPAVLIDRETLAMERYREQVIASLRVPAQLLGRVP